VTFCRSLRRPTEVRGNFSSGGRGFAAYQFPLHKLKNFALNLGQIIH
jgi:hypothetical protein